MIASRIVRFLFHTGRSRAKIQPAIASDSPGEFRRQPAHNDNPASNLMLHSTVEMYVSPELLAGLYWSVKIQLILFYQALHSWAQLTCMSLLWWTSNKCEHESQEKSSAFSVFTWCHVSLLGIWFNYYVKPFAIVVYTNMAVSSREWKPRIECVRSCDQKPYLLNETKGGWRDLHKNRTFHSSKMAAVSLFTRPTWPPWRYVNILYKLLNLSDASTVSK